MVFLILNFLLNNHGPSGVADANQKFKPIYFCWCSDPND